MDLAKKKCEPCEGGTKPFDIEESKKYLSLLKTDWELIQEEEFKIRKKYKFEDFVKAMEFVNKVAEIANEENHHPDIFISYSRVTITLSTHSIGGLSPNDFIVASKTELIES